MLFKPLPYLFMASATCPSLTPLLVRLRTLSTLALSLQTLSCGRDSSAQHTLFPNRPWEDSFLLLFFPQLSGLAFNLDDLHHGKVKSCLTGAMHTVGTNIPDCVDTECTEITVAGEGQG